MKDVFLCFVLLIMGILFVRGAQGIKSGRNKRDFLTERNLTVPKDGHYGYLPMGLGWIIFAISLLANIIMGVELDSEIGRTVGLTGLFGGGILCFVFMFVKPNFVKPQWLLWLESHYDKTTIAYMFAQARRNPESWERKISTQEGLEKWAAEMAQQYEAQFFIRSRNS